MSRWRSRFIYGQLLIFYAIFYAVLAALFAICMSGLFATLDKREPTWTLDRSLIGVNPGLGFRPLSSRDSTFISYNSTNSTTFNEWVTLIDDFLKPYQQQQEPGKNVVACDFDKPPKNGEVCATNVSNLGNCNAGSKYGYGTSSPCIFLKLNRIFGWEPEFFSNSTTDMPEDLRDHIDNLTDKAELQQVWVSCNGLTAEDKKNVGSFNYSPRGFPKYYYPYKNYPNYLSPIVAVKIVNVKHNVMVTIECRSWAKNIKYINSALNRQGSITFEIKVDADK